MSPVIWVQDLFKAYVKEKPVLKGISFTVERGEIFGFLGPNGAGKTTTIEILEGYLPADSGTVEVLGMNPFTAGNRLKTRIGLMLQETSLPRFLTVREALQFFGSLYPNPFPVAEMLERFQLTHQANTQIGRLSGGQRRKLDMAISIIGRPDLVFLDEPTTGFDPHARREAWDLVRQIRDSGSTIFLTTQHMDEAEFLCDRVAILRNGQIAALDTPEQLKQKIKLPVVIRFQHTPAVARDRIAALAGVTKLEESDGYLVIATTESEKTMRELYRIADESGFEIRNLTIQYPTLEEVFLSLT